MFPCNTSEDARQFLNTQLNSQLSSFSLKKETALIVRNTVKTGVPEL